MLYSPEDHNVLCTQQKGSITEKHLFWLENTISVEI